MPFRIVDAATEARAQREAREAEQKKLADALPVQEWREVNGVRLAIPRWVSEAEKRNPGVKYEFIHGFDRMGDRFSQWCEAAPPKPAALASDERWTGKQHRFDYITRTWIEDHVPPAPPHIERIREMLPEDDPRRPYWDPAQRQYLIRDSRPLDALQDAPVRDDLVSPNGYPMTGAPGMHSMGDAIPDGAGSVYPASGGTEGGAA